MEQEFEPFQFNKSACLGNSPRSTGLRVSVMRGFSHGDTSWRALETASVRPA